VLTPLKYLHNKLYLLEHLQVNDIIVINVRGYNKSIDPIIGLK